MSKEQKPPTKDTEAPEPNPAWMTEEQRKSIKEMQIGLPPFDDLEPLTYSQETLNRWTSIPPETSLVVPLSRRDLDHLFFTFAQALGALGTLQTTVRQLTHNDMAGAEVAYQKSFELRQMGETNFRKFFLAIMDKAVPNG